MEVEPALVNQFNYYQGRLSEKTKPVSHSDLIPRTGITLLT